ncbi:putative ribonuclease H-like domain-containing protein [Tanacetum coccineum]
MITAPYSLILNKRYKGEVLTPGKPHESSFQNIKPIIQLLYQSTGIQLLLTKEVDESEASDKDRKDEQVTRNEFERLLQQEKHIEHPNSTNSINTVSTPVSTAGLSFTFDDQSSPVNAAEASNSFEDHLFERFSPFRNAFTLPDVSNMDVKSAFLYGTIKEEVYVCQPLGFEDPHFPNKVYKVYVDDIIFGSTKKSLCDEFEGLMHKRFQMSSMGELTFFLGLQVQQKKDGIFISQDKYVADILKKFDFCPLSMIGSLMYLTYSRPGIMFAVCACARFQVTPKMLHLHVVKRIFRYLKGQPKLGLWYPRDSPFDLEAFSDSDYAGASLDGKSITGSCQFLGKRLISWQCDKDSHRPQCCSSLNHPKAFDGLVDETVYKEWEDRMERVVTTASRLDAEQDSGSINRTQSMATLNESFSQGTNSGSGLGCQDTILGGVDAQTRFETTSK